MNKIAQLILAFILGFFVVSCIAWCSKAYAYDETNIWDGTSIYAVLFTQEASETFAWDPVVGATGYDLEVLYIDSDPMRVVATVHTPTPQITINYFKSGHLVIKVKATGGTEWCYSTDANCAVFWEQPYNPQGWLLYWRLPSPGGLGGGQ